MPVNLIVGNDGSNSLQGTADADLIYGFDPNGPQSQASAIIATRFATGFSQPLFAVAPPGDTSRLFIVEKTGQIKVLDLATGGVLATPFLDVSSQILTDGERGLLGLAFDPGFASNGFLYVNLINLSGDTEIRRYHVSSNPNVADPASVTPIITIDQTAASNHKAGWLGFGPDGDLYIATGDGGSTPGSAQDVNSLLGKILRIDVHGDDFPGDFARNYAVPVDNPFVGVPGADEIFALGLRNPWRGSFDRGLGDFYIADVGQAQWEEINIGQKGANYGWPTFEGPPGTSPPTVGPIHFYDRSVGQSITGGYVYRGEAEALQGQYFFADFVQGKVFTLRFDGTAWVAADRTAQIVTDFGAINNPSSFGEDAQGNLYITDFDGEIFRLTPIAASADLADTLRGLGGNDMLFGGSGDDTLDGGEGNDALLGGAGGDYIDGGAGFDYIDGGAGNDTLVGDEGNDLLLGGAGNDYIAGGEGNDVLGGGEGDDGLLGGAGADYLDGGEGNDVLFGGAGNDGLNGGAGIDYIDGGEGNDLLLGGEDNDTLDGGGGNDGLLGGAGADYIVGGEGNDVLGGGEGDDQLLGSAGADYIDGGAGADYIDGGAGNDGLLGGEGNDALAGGIGNDNLLGGLGNDFLFGGAGGDVFDLRQDVNAGDLDYIGDLGSSDFVALSAGSSVTYSQFGDNVIVSVAVVGGSYNIQIAGGASPLTIEQVQAQTMFF